MAAILASPLGPINQIIGGFMGALEDLLKLVKRSYNKRNNRCTATRVMVGAPRASLLVSEMQVHSGQRDRRPA